MCTSVRELGVCMCFFFLKKIWSCYEAFTQVNFGLLKHLPRQEVHLPVWHYRKINNKTVDRGMLSPG